MSESPLRVVSKSLPVPDTNGLSGTGATPSTPEEVAAWQEDQRRLEELRALLILPEQQQLARLQQRFDDPYERAKDFSAILPQVINTHNEKDVAELGQAIAPNLVPALAQVSHQQSEELENALRPIMLPSIRKAIQDALSVFVQQVDQTMKYGFNMRWRFEALRSGTPFAEFVMSRTLLYRVEQVLLIHKKTGIVLCEEAAPFITQKNADVVSSLLVALNDFARDSFKADETQSLEKLDHGDLEVWVEGFTSAHDMAYLAVLIRGNAPESLRTDTLQPVLARILNRRRQALLAFDGDTSPFESCRPDLRDCLQAAKVSASPGGVVAGFKLPPTVAVPLALVTIVLLVWAFLNWRDHRRWQSYLAQLQREAGLIVTEEDSRLGLLGSRFSIEGLRDPLANDPQQLLQQTPLNLARVQSRWQGYYALDPDIVTRRAAQLLEAPTSVKFEARDSVLYASGTAPRAWILSAQPMGRMLPGVTRFDTAQLLDADQQRLLEMQRELEKNRLQFSLGTARLLEGQDAELQKMANRLQEAVALGNYTQRSLTIEVIGQTDTTGSEAVNAPLRLERAQSILKQLVARGIPRPNLVASGGLPPTETNTSEAEQQRSRAVVFKITLADPQQSRLSK